MSSTQKWSCLVDVLVPAASQVNIAEEESDLDGELADL